MTLWFDSGEYAYSALGEEAIAALSHERWERRDPFFPLIESEVPYRYRSVGRRDPFRSVLDVDPVRNSDFLTPLELFEASQLLLVGVVWNDNGYRALIETPDKMAYIARVGTAIGVNGTVTSISAEHLIVRESVRNIFGEEKIREVELNLYMDEEDVTLSSVSILHEGQSTTQADDGMLRNDGAASEPQDVATEPSLPLPEGSLPEGKHRLRAGDALTQPTSMDLLF